VAGARIRARRAGGRDASDADVTVAAELRERFEPWPTARGVDTSQSPEDAARQAVAVVGPF
jgi:predicted kinase